MSLKKQFILLLLIALITASSGCTVKQADNEAALPEITGSGMLPEREASVAETEQLNQGEDISEQNNTLIAYFTWAENVAEDGELDAVSSASVQMPGNVGQIASWIQQETGGSLFSIQTQESYSMDYDRCLDRAADEKAENARPALKQQIENPAKYDTIFIGYPNWHYTAPMAVFSFIEENDLSGKRVVLFCSHGTGGLASSVKDIAAALPNSDIEENVLGIYREETADAEETVQEWLMEIGY